MGDLQDPTDGGTDSIYKAYFLGLCKGISPPKYGLIYGRYLHFRILKFPLKSIIDSCGKYHPQNAKSPAVIPNPGPTLGF